MTTTQTPSARRHRSRHALLDVIRRESGVTRADLKLLTGLSRSAVAEGVQDLLDERLVVEDVMAPGGKGAGRGRPSALLVATPAAGLVVGVDFGHEHVAVAVADTTGRVLAQQRLGVDVDHQAEAALSAASGTVIRLLAQTGRSIDEVRTIAAGIPAPLELTTRRIRPNSVMVGWSDRDPAEELAHRLGRRVIVANDAEMGAQGEVRFGAARGMRDFIYVKASEGVGASVVLNGSVYRGSAGLAGEIGHTRLGDAGGWCRCGNRGCLETVLSSSFVNQRMREAGITAADPVFPLRNAASDPVVSAFVTEAGRTLGRVLADLCNWLNPAGVILGGVLGTAGAAMVEGVRESVTRFTPPAISEGLVIKPAQLGLRSELLGAVAAAVHDAFYIDEMVPARPPESAVRSAV